MHDAYCNRVIAIYPVRKLAASYSCIFCIFDAKNDADVDDDDDEIVTSQLDDAEKAISAPASLKFSLVGF